MTAFVLWIGATITAAGSPPEAPAWWDTQIAASIDRAPARKTEWVSLLEKCPREHRTGLAFDFVLGNGPGDALFSTSPANRLALSQTPAYRWLVANADRFGFVNYPYEPWHWEWTGEAI